MNFNQTYLFMVLLVVSTVISDNSIECTGKLKNRIVSQEQLDMVISEHQKWLNESHDKILSFSEFERRLKDPRRANLCKAWLINKNLNKAILSGANLSGAALSGANLSDAILIQADLSSVHLNRANLHGANMDHANLSGAYLIGTNLSNASLNYADLERAFFEPDFFTDITDIAFARNLSKMDYLNSPSALIILRNQFKNAGYRDQERELTYAIEHQITMKMIMRPDTEIWNLFGGEKEEFEFSKRLNNFPGVLEGLFRFIFYDLTTKWGMESGRALLILLFFMVLFTIPYYFALSKPAVNNGIWCKWNHMCSGMEKSEPELLHKYGLKAVLTGLYFSLLYSFSIGWREFNIGNWIQHLQTRDYTLFATGWVRAVSGTQSLISLYLVVIWVLTYFGRPFD